MHTIFIAAVGSVQEPWQTQAISQYLARLTPYARVRIAEIPDERESPTVPAARLREKEASMLLKQLPDTAVLIALDEGGKSLDSREWAELLETEGGRGAPIAFAVGGANGLNDAVRARAKHRVSFGKQTVPHILARIILLEQLYRAETILQGKTYHR